MIQILQFHYVRNLNSTYILGHLRQMESLQWSQYLLHFNRVHWRFTQMASTVGYRHSSARSKWLWSVSFSEVISQLANIPLTAPISVHYQHSWQICESAKSLFPICFNSHSSGEQLNAVRQIQMSNDGNWGTSNLGGKHSEKICLKLAERWQCPSVLAILVGSDYFKNGYSSAHLI